MPNLYKKLSVPSQQIHHTCTRKNLLTSQQVFPIFTQIGGNLSFGTTLPQQPLHLHQLFGSNILPFQQSSKQTDHIRFVCVRIDSSRKVFFSS